MERKRSRSPDRPGRESRVDRGREQDRVRKGSEMKDKDWEDSRAHGRPGRDSSSYYQRRGDGHNRREEVRRTDEDRKRWRDARPERERKDRERGDGMEVEGDRRAVEREHRPRRKEREERDSYDRYDRDRGDRRRDYHRDNGSRYERDRYERDRHREPRLRERHEEEKGREDRSISASATAGGPIHSSSSSPEGPVIPQMPSLLPAVGQNPSSGKETKKKEPISLEAILKKKEEELERKDRPRFMSKKERQKLKEAPMEDQMNKTSADSDRRHGPESTLKVPTSSQPAMVQSNVSDLRKEYLGVRKMEKKVIRGADRLKFVFEWTEDEDTSKEVDPLYDLSRRKTPLFSQRGHLGGTKEIRVGKGLIDERNWRKKDLTEMSERDWRIFRDEFQITAKGGNIPFPLRFWEESNLPPVVLDSLRRERFADPFPIQRAAIPVGLNERDMIGIAETGAGKTVAFILPLLVYVSQFCRERPATPEEGPYAIVLAPTRELTQQIERTAKTFGDPMGIRCVSVVGGVGKEFQAFELRDGAEVIIATPGRLIDCLKSSVIVLNQCFYVVLDEADEMIAMNLESQVNEILESLPASNLRPENEDEEDSAKKYRITAMFTATMPAQVERLARDYLRRPAIIQIGDPVLRVDKIRQEVEFTTEAKKMPRLLGLLSTLETPIIIFVNMKKAADALARDIRKSGFQCSVLHGGKTQDQREAALEAFKAGKFSILVATQVAGRGLDIPGVKNVINFTMPTTIKEYIHRIGRTGRAGDSGCAISFLTNDDTDIMYDLRKLLSQTGNRIPPELRAHEAAIKKQNIRD
eukprot:TRINITY_DN9121_c1_g1_i3.p2 TRINITY_DN9121_c1_g1~~TRINITY_DN9121_c1_g1_i3.p2  ORF type:complete len:811 (-),score=254.39 TRINITY_DN9121_c1_g1_i3:63-2495(-)